MSSLGEHPYDHFKDRRYAGIFWSTLVGMFVLLLVGFFLVAILYQLEMLKSFLMALPVVGFLWGVWLALKFRRFRRCRSGKCPRGPLSRDEMRVARSKLRNERTTIQPASPGPDTDLRY